MRKSHSSTSTVHSYIGLANITQMSLYNILTKHIYLLRHPSFFNTILAKSFWIYGFGSFFLGGDGGMGERCDDSKKVL